MGLLNWDIKTDWRIRQVTLSYTNIKPCPQFWVTEQVLGNEQSLHETMLHLKKRNKHSMKRIFLPGARLPLLPGGSGLKDVQSPLIPQAWGRERRVGAIPQVQEWIQIITAVPGRKRETSASWSPVGLAKQNFNRISTDCDFIEKVSKISLRNLLRHLH